MFLHLSRTFNYPDRDQDSPAGEGGPSKSLLAAFRTRCRVSFTERERTNGIYSSGGAAELTQRYTYDANIPNTHGVQTRMYGRKKRKKETKN